MAPTLFFNIHEYGNEMLKLFIANNMEESSLELSGITRKFSNKSPNAKRSGQRGKATFSYFVKCFMICLSIKYSEVLDSFTFLLKEACRR